MRRARLLSQGKPGLARNAAHPAGGRGADDGDVARIRAGLDSAQAPRANEGCEVSCSTRRPAARIAHLPCHHHFVDTRRRLDLRTRDSQSLCDRHLFVDAPVRDSLGSGIRAGDSFVRISDEPRGAASFDSGRVRRPRLDGLSGLLGNDRLTLLGDLRFQGDDALSIS